MPVGADHASVSIAASPLSEPHTLAHAKRRLFPDATDDDTDAVVDAQFTDVDEARYAV